ncbi:MAG TPA: R3H domain-containing nucleic acid-binding protein [Candidatus Paceibacterota bacterium]|jgi:predicted RNA-binding protein Jag|nr:R3H domain-containing nucleic acid-binding protein [Candidatus Paceibacterota bacterium]
MNPSPETTLKELLDAAGVSYSNISRTEAAGQTILSIEASDARDLIGPRGEVIQAIDHLVKKILEEKSEAPEGDLSTELGAGPPTGLGVNRAEMFLVDVGGYRTKQIKDLQAKALMMAERARSFQYDVELSPMTAYERLIVHTTLQNAPHVKTESQGEGRSRRVVIKYSAQ